jgi:hypothetical protein
MASGTYEDSPEASRDARVHVKSDRITTQGEESRERRLSREAVAKTSLEHIHPISYNDGRLKGHKLFENSTHLVRAV